MTLSQVRKASVQVDLIRTIAILSVIVLHATRDATSFQPEADFEVWRWWIVDIYQSLSRVGVPLFVMLSGALLLQPSKKEPLRLFFKKRWTRIGLPFLFWGQFTLHGAFSPITKVLPLVSFFKVRYLILTRIFAFGIFTCLWGFTS